MAQHGHHVGVDFFPEDSQRRLIGAVAALYQILAQAEERVPADVKQKVDRQKDEQQGQQGYIHLPTAPAAALFG